MSKASLAFFLMGLAACAGAEGNGASSSSTSTSTSTGAPPADAAPPPIEKQTIPYGLDPAQFGDLRVPSGNGPFPVLVVIHGGCWLSFYGLDLMDAMSARFAEKGIATWNIEYRRLSDPGSGYPGTFQDIGAAIDKLRELGPTHKLDLQRVVTVGHSAGGHLAVWAAARSKLPADEPARGADPLPIRVAISLAGILNLQESLDLDVCSDQAAKVVGGQPADLPERYARLSPKSLLPIGVPQVLVHGTADALVPYVMSEHYLQAAQAAGEKSVVLKPITGGDHFAVIEPSAAAWKDVEDAIVGAMP